MKKRLVRVLCCVIVLCVYSSVACADPFQLDLTYRVFKDKTHSYIYDDENNRVLFTWDMFQDFCNSNEEYKDKMTELMLDGCFVIGISKDMITCAYCGSDSVILMFGDTDTQTAGYQIVEGTTKELETFLTNVFEKSCDEYAVIESLEMLEIIQDIFGK